MSRCGLSPDSQGSDAARSEPRSLDGSDQPDVGRLTLAALRPAILGRRLQVRTDEASTDANDRTKQRRPRRDQGDV